MKNSLKILDVVALLTDIPADKIQAGQVGTIVEELAEGVFEVEFADNQGKTIAMCAIEAVDLLKLTHDYALSPDDDSAVLRERLANVPAQIERGDYTTNNTMQQQVKQWIAK